MSIEDHDNSDIYVTVCDETTTAWQLPLIFATLAMVLILGFNCGGIYILHKILDPVKMLKMSRSCFPARFFESIWPEDQKPLKGPVLHFLLNPCAQTFDESNKRLIEKSGNDLMHWAIKNGYLHIIKTILGPGIEIDVTIDLIKKSIMLEADIKVIKMISKKAQKQKCHVPCDKDKVAKLMKMLPKKRGLLFMFSSFTLLAQKEYVLS